MYPFKFLKKIAKVGVFGFSTNSSAACLPLNVIGDAAVNVIVNAKQGELDEKKYNS